MKKKQIMDMLQGIMKDRGVPKNIKTSIEESLGILNGNKPEGEKLSYIISVLDEASNDPNISVHARTMVWSTISFLECMSSVTEE